MFPAELKFPKDYPLAPPTMKFLADMWHPNGMVPFISPSKAYIYSHNGLSHVERSNKNEHFLKRLVEEETKRNVHLVYPSGLVCISILHPPGDDPNHYEHASERWSPIQSVEKILISVMSMLAEPNDESPANVEAAKMWRERRDEYEKTVRDGVRRMLGL